MATVFTTAGKAWVNQRIDPASSTTIGTQQFVAWGTGAGTASVGDTTLFTEASEARVSGAASQFASNIYQVIGTLSANGSKTITNAGLLSSAASGAMMIHGDFAGIPVLSADLIQFTFQLTIS